MKKTALVTGASGAIGSAIAKRLAREGCDLVLLGYQSKEALAALTKSLRDGTAQTIRSYTGDLADPETIRRVFSEAFPADSDRLDLVVNCAGVTQLGLLQELSDEEWRRVLDVNLSAVFSVCRAAIPRMLREKRGHILNISSVWGCVGGSMEVAYSAAKGGVNALTRALAKELAPSGIAVNALACGYIDTKMNAHLSDEEREALVAEIPAARPGTPEEVADTVALLAQAPAYLTGQIITLDGGWT